jgi:hypothetical protein
MSLTLVDAINGSWVIKTYNMLQQPTRPLLLMESTLHVSTVQLCGSLTIPYMVKIHLKSIKFIKKSRTIISYIGNSGS